jgi:hypothetical protein
MDYKTGDIFYTHCVGYKRSYQIIKLKTYKLTSIGKHGKWVSSNYKDIQSLLVSVRGLILLTDIFRELNE